MPYNHQEYQKNRLRELGFDVEALNQAQIDAIMIPEDAPENYAHDGEVSGERAKAIWKEQLERVGLSEENVSRAIRKML